MICLVDDTQWLDLASAQILAFVARRLHAESVALVFGLREPSQNDVLNGLPELVVEGLGDDDARVLLESVIAGPLDDRIRDRIITETGATRWRCSSCRAAATQPSWRAASDCPTPLP